MSTATKEKPILFSGEMVRAILDDRKTMTRRIVKPQPPEDWSPMAVERYCPAIDDGDMMRDGPEIFGAYNEDWGVKCPYGGPGDRLWVRETFDWVAGEVRQSGKQPKRFDQVIYRADDCASPPSGKWTPAIHMPRWASRLTLELTAVRVERLLEISAADVVAEGFPFSSDLDQFRDTWKRINGKGSWESNPWCWVLSFKRIKTGAIERE